MVRLFIHLVASFILFTGMMACKKSGATPTPAPTPTPTPVTPTYELAWQDDFTGTQLSLTDWYHRIPGVRHDGFNDATTVSLDGNGNLLIKVYSDTISGTVTHHTGMIATKAEYKYGKFEVRASFVNQSGSWSAYWLQSATMGTPVGNPQTAGMEIDVVETLSKDNRVHHNLHWDGYGVDHKTTGLITGDLGTNTGNFHIYTLEWTPTYYKFYVDGTLTWTYTANVSQRSEFIILSSEVKNYAVGSWAGPIPAGGYGSLANTQTVMKVDYVKYYKML